MGLADCYFENTENPATLISFGYAIVSKSLKIVKLYFEIIFNNHI